MGKSWLWKCHVAARWEEGHGSDVPTVTEGLVTNTEEGVHRRRSPVAHPQCAEKGRSRQDSQNHLLLTDSFQETNSVPLSPSMSPFVRFPTPLPLTHLLFLETSQPASLKNCRATLAAVQKSFFSRTASPHRQRNSWFCKIKLLQEATKLFKTLSSLKR